MSNGADHPETGDHWHTVTLRVDGHERRIVVDVRTTLLDALRDRVGCMSPKKGCDHGQCGSCTVLLDSRRVVTCLALAVSHDGADIVTAAGLAERQRHPLHDAFVDHDAFQCGYCTPGQICSATGMLAEFDRGDPSAVTSPGGSPELDDAEIRERLSGNLCRCAAYPNIVAAVRSVAANREARP
ncbi:(2Fe-2S)-binding protein [Rhodococcus sp. O3]|uniref:(2Fe-2S)-binding protein n=1 Tax=Rhodococcus sp. O3 TaxID=3404919 RepID=UPI003B671EB8